MAMDVSEKYLEVLKSSFQTKDYRNNDSHEGNKSFIKEVEMCMDELFYEVIDSKKFDDAVALAQAYLYISHVTSNAKKVLYDTEVHLTKCLELLNGEELNQKAILIVISALNELAELAYKQKNVRKSKSFLNYALQQCVKYKNGKERYLEPIYIPTELGVEHEENAHLLDKLHLHIVTYLQEMYRVNQDDTVMQILYNSTHENTCSTQMEISEKSEFLKVLKSSFRTVNIDPIIALSGRKKKFIRMVESKMDKLFHEVINSHDVKLDDMAILARAYLYMSSIYSTKKQKEELQVCEDHLTKCTMLLEEKELDSKSVLIVIRALNELAYVKLKLQEPEKTELFLNNARRLYLAYTKGSDEYPEVIDVAMTLGIEYDENCKNLFEYSNEINLVCLNMLPNKKLFIPEDLQNDLSKWIHTVGKMKRIKDVKVEKVREEFVEILRSSYEMSNAYLLHEGADKKSTIVDEKRIKAIMGRMKRLFRITYVYKRFSVDTNFNESIILAHAYLYIYHTLSKKEGEINSRFECLTKCMKLLNERELDPKAILIAMDALNQSAKIYMSINEIDEAKSYTEKAIQLYVRYTEEVNYPTPINIPDIVSLKCKLQSDDTLHTLFIDSLYSFDNLIKTAKSGETVMYNTIVWIHKSLNGKLNFLELIGNSYTYYISFLQAIMLTKYFVLRKRFIEIKNYLAIAYYLWQKFFTEIYVEGKQKLYEDKIYRYANVLIKQNLITYGMYLLRMSREKLLQNKQDANEKDDRLCEASSSKIESPTTSEEQCKELLFTDIEEYTKQFTSVIADKYIFNYEDAKKIFVTVLQWLHELKVHYNREENSVLHEDIMANTGLAYRYFANYEPDEDKRIKLIKRYIEIFKNVINTTSLNTECNATQAKCILIDLGIAYSIILDIKTNSLQITNEVPKEKSMDIVKFVKNSMLNFQLFLESFKDGT